MRALDFGWLGALVVVACGGGDGKRAETPASASVANAAASEKLTSKPPTPSTERSKVADRSPKTVCATAKPVSRAESGASRVEVASRLPSLVSKPSSEVVPPERKARDNPYAMADLAAA